MRYCGELCRVRCAVWRVLYGIVVTHAELHFRVFYDVVMKCVELRDGAGYGTVATYVDCATMYYSVFFCFCVWTSALRLSNGNNKDRPESGSRRWFCDFRNTILAGRWPSALELLGEMEADSPAAARSARFVILKQQFLEVGLSIFIGPLSFWRD